MQFRLNRRNLALTMRIGCVKVLAGPLLAAGGFLAATGSSAETPLESAARDLARYVDCELANDRRCVLEMTYADWSKGSIRRHATSLAQLESRTAPLGGSQGPRLESIRFENPVELYLSAVGSFVVVPYVRSAPSVREEGWLERSAFYIGAANDEGSSWRFIDGYSLQPDDIDLVIPGYDPRSLPEVVDRITLVPRATRSEYLRTTEGRFHFDGESAAYVLSFDVRRNTDEAIDLTVSFDDPLSPDRPRTLRTMLPAGQEELAIASPAMQGFEGGKVYSVMILGGDPESGAELFEHFQPLLFGPTNQYLPPTGLMQTGPEGWRPIIPEP